MGSFSGFSIILTITTFLHTQISFTNASYNVGVNYGMMGNNLPPPAAVIDLYQKYNIGKVRLFEPNHEVLEALKNKEIPVSYGIRNEDIQKIASSQEAANAWFAKNVEPYLDEITFEYITVGNEIIPGAYANFAAPAMRNLQNTLDAKSLEGISLTTVIATSALGTSFPPSAGEFLVEAIGPMTDVLDFLLKEANPILVNVYPYLAYASDPINIRLDYALFTAPGPVVQDGNLGYQNLFDAIIDSVYWAMEKVGCGDVSVAIGETGWPNGGNGNFTTPELASTYNKNVIQHVRKGTPKRPNEFIEAYIFAVFNENLKPAGIEQYWGIFYPNMEPVYPLF